MRGGSVMRLRGFIRKEWLQIMRDPSSLAIAFVLPVILLLIFGYGISLDAKHVPVAIVIETPGPEASSFAGGFYNSPYFEPVAMNSVQAAIDALNRWEVKGIIWLKSDFAREYLNFKSPPVSVIVNGIDANTARLVEGYVSGVWAKWLETQALKAGIEISLPVELDYRIWFNSAVRSRNFLVPGLFAIIMTLIGALLTALIIAREWERGTMEALLVTPVTVKEMLLGKLAPYFILGMGGFSVAIFMAFFLFDVPLRGSFIILVACTALFLITALGMGLLISTISAGSQFVAAQAAIIVTFLPAFLLSGFIFDIASMPGPIQAVTHIIAARYYVAILQTLFLAGDVWSVILPNAAALAAMACLFLGLVWKKNRKTLD